MTFHETEAIILRSFKLAEADKIIVCLTENAGLIRGVAKGARRLKSRFGASLEPFTLVRIAYMEREGRELVSIRRVEIIRSYFKLAKIEDAVPALDYLCELIVEFAPPNLADQRFFRLMRTCVACIDEESTEVQSFVGYFEFWSLKLAGFLPDFNTCGVCGRGLRGSEVPLIFQAQGGILKCARCAEGTGTKIGNAVFELLCSAQRQGPRRWASLFSQSPSAVQEGFRSLVQSLIELHLERAPRGLYTFAGHRTLV